MTLASVVISAGKLQRLERLQVGVVVDVAVERGDDVRAAPPPSSSSWFSGCAFASEMMPTLAQRVCASTTASAVSARQREAQQLVVADLRRASRAVLSPSSPISAAVLYTKREVAVGDAHRRRR